MALKKILFLLVVVLLLQPVRAQFSKASLQATGLTCAMCSNAINKALQVLPFVESVKSDIKNSAFSIVFKQDKPVNLDAIRDAVEEAGFFVGGLQVTGTFSELSINPGTCVKIGNAWFLFLKTGSRLLNGEVTLRVLDKSFLTAKEFKKISAAVTAPSLQTGKADASRSAEGLREGERIFYVTI